LQPGRRGPFIDTSPWQHQGSQCRAQTVTDRASWVDVVSASAVMSGKAPFDQIPVPVTRVRCTRGTLTG
jgi:hypothetical protein